MSSDHKTPSATREEFIRSLADSGLSGLADLRREVEGLPAGVDAAEAARHLIALGAMTGYQADAVLGRRFADLQIGNYEVLDRLGAGGMGTVFKARHRRMKRVVALKILSLEVARSDQFAQRFQREVETVARLSHPNIVMAFDADEADAGPFLVMEFVDGRDLTTEVQVNGPMSPAEAVDSLLQAARGLEYAHAQGIVHRDIKPANLLRDASGVVKVADLGLARLTAPGPAGVDTSITQAGGVVGTMDYMPPEQALDATAVDHRADIYSLGCTLHFLVTGRPPYRGASIMALLLAHQNGPIPSLAEARPDVPAGLDHLFRRMVAKNQRDRDQSMADVVRALEALAAGGDLGTSRRPSVPGPTTVREPDQSNPTIAFHGGDKASAPSSDRFSPTLDSGPALSPSEVRRVADLTVVLVEPSRTQAGIVKKYLATLGIDRVHVAGSGGEALKVTKQVRADVLLCAMHLADMSGPQLAEAALSDPGCPGVGFVLATSESDAQESGPMLPDSPRTVLLPKPFDLQTLAQSLGKATQAVAEW